MSYTPQHAYESLYKRGIAVGHSDIRRDSIDFRWRNEFFSFPTFQALTAAHYTGQFYEAKVKTLRKLQSEAKERVYAH